MYSRAIEPRLRLAIAASPAIFLHGARQCGKTTLARELMGDDWPARYLTFDNRSTLAAATEDPEAFLASLDGPVVLDEVQRVPEIFRALKAEIDADRRPGRFLLTGSANALMVPTVAESLVGRVEMLMLRPLSQSEIEGTSGDLIAELFADSFPARDGDLEPAELRRRILAGGFPEVVQRADPASSASWFESYALLIVQREIQDLLQVEDLRTVSRLLDFLAARAGGLVNFAEVSRSAAIAQTTLKRYVDLLEATFLVERLPAWSANLAKRFVKAPKLFLGDSGLLCHLLGADEDKLAVDPKLFGQILENFVYLELARQLTWSRLRARIYHYRTHEGEEVDLLLENAAGQVVAIEVKSTTSPTGQDFRSLKSLAAALGDRFLRGFLFHTGKEDLPFGPKLRALPVHYLWTRGKAG